MESLESQAVEFRLDLRSEKSLEVFKSRLQQQSVGSMITKPSVSYVSGIWQLPSRNDEDRLNKHSTA